MKFPRMLILSNECLSQTNSNGRTLKNFLINYPKEKVAQFYLHGEPDFDACNNYFNVTDGMALNAFLFKKSKETHGELKKKDERKPSRNALTMIMREVVWNSGRWAKRGFWRWVDDLQPQVILLQAGDCGFMFKLARKLSKRFSVPIIIYNSEGYFFKKHDYMQSKGIAKIFYPFFRFYYRKEFKKTMKKANKVIYICDKLKEAYDKYFEVPSETIYTATTIIPSIKSKKEDFNVSYLGNIGVGRHEGLIDISKCLQKIDKNLKLDVYGKIPNEDIKQEFERNPGINYKGFVSYDEVVEIMQTSNILVHTENFSDFYKEDSKFAFSTKIADSLASGSCFLLYAPKELACSEYLVNNSCAYVVSDFEELRKLLSELYEDKEKREKYLENALTVVQQNHNAKKNARRFCEVILEAFEENESFAS